MNTAKNLPPKHTQIIAWITGILTLLSALFAFILSFNALTDLATQHGVSIPPLFPFVVEFAVIIFSLNVLYRSLSGEPTKLQWGLIIGASLLAGIFNVAHAENDTLSRAMAAMPSLFLLLSFESFLSLIKHRVKHTSITQSIEQLNEQAERLSVQVERLNVRKDEIESQISELQSVQNGVLNGKLNDANAKRIEGKQAALNALIQYVNAYPNASYSEIGDAIERSPSTVSGYVNELIESGRLHRNGNGLKVTQ